MMTQNRQPSRGLFQYFDFSVAKVEVPFELARMVCCYNQTMTTSKPKIIMFLGYPGSGKSYFARQLADKIHAVRMNGDSMRIALFKTVEAINEHPDKKTLNDQTFSAIDYAVSQILKVGHTVVYDAHHNKRSIREDLEKLATEYDAVPVVVWVKTPHEVALKRGQTREASADSRNMTEEQMIASMNRHMANFDEPAENEHVITIDGTAPFDKQFASYTEQVAAL